MAAYSIGWDDAKPRPWHKLASATIGTDAPGGTLAIQIRIADPGSGASTTLAKAEVVNALQKLINLMRETQGPHF